MKQKKILFLFSIVFIISCNLHQTSEKSNLYRKLNGKQLEFYIKINNNNYLNSIYGQSPQIAIWLENKQTQKYKNVYVTYRAGRNDWKGKVNCKVALPFWESRLKKYSEYDPQIKNSISAVTSATSKTDIINVKIDLKENSMWTYFIEVNVSGDYNEEFQQFSKSGIPDTEGNGQPSIVYRGVIDYSNRVIKNPKIIGRTHQTQAVDSLYTDLEKITSAKYIFSDISMIFL